MASGKPDYNRTVTIQGAVGGEFVAIKVDANGQMYIAMTGQQIGVNNLASDYVKEGGNVAVTNHPSDYFKADQAIGSISNAVTVNQSDYARTISGNIAGITNSVTVDQADAARTITGNIAGITDSVSVDQNDSDRTMKGKDGATPHYVAVDSAGIILSRLKGAYGAELKDISVDTTGILLSRLKGAYGGVLKDISVDDVGILLARLKGSYGGALKDIAVDTDGKMVAAIQGKINDEELLAVVCDCGEGDDVATWSGVGDATGLVANAGYKKSGAYGMSYTIDADASGSLWGTIVSTAARGDFSAYTSDYLHLWVYLSTLDYLIASGDCLNVDIGSDGGNYQYYGKTKATLTVGWNLVKLSLASPVGSVGTPDFSNISYLTLTLNEVGGNTHDFTVAVDTIVIVKHLATAGDLTNLSVNEQGRLQAQMSGVYGGQLSPIAVDSSGVMKANLVTQDIPVLTTRPLLGNHYFLQAFNSDNAAETITIVNDTTHVKGMVMSGVINISATSSFKTAYIRIGYDGVLINGLTLQNLYLFGITGRHSYPIYLISYDDTNFIYSLGISPGETFSTSLVLEYTKPAGVHTTSWCIGLQYQ